MNACFRSLSKLSTYLQFLYVHFNSKDPFKTTFTNILIYDCREYACCSCLYIFLDPTTKLLEHQKVCNCIQIYCKFSLIPYSSYPLDDEFSSWQHWGGRKRTGAKEDMLKWDWTVEINHIFHKRNMLTFKPTRVVRNRLGR